MLDLKYSAVVVAFLFCVCLGLLEWWVMQERGKERGRRRERWDAVCGRKEGRVAGGKPPYCILNTGKGVLKGLLSFFFAPCRSLSFYHTLGIYSFEFHLSQDGKDGIFGESACLVDPWARR